VPISRTFRLARDECVDALDPRRRRHQIAPIDVSGRKTAAMVKGERLIVYKGAPAFLKS